MLSLLWAGVTMLQQTQNTGSCAIRGDNTGASSAISGSHSGLCFLRTNAHGQQSDLSLHRRMRTRFLATRMARTVSLQGQDQRRHQPLPQRRHPHQPPLQRQHLSPSAASSLPLNVARQLLHAFQSAKVASQLVSSVSERVSRHAAHVSKRSSRPSNAALVHLLDPLRPRALLLLLEAGPTMAPLHANRMSRMCRFKASVAASALHHALAAPAPLTSLLELLRLHPASFRIHRATNTAL